MRRAWSKRTLTIVEATLNDGTGKIKAVWFNQPYLKNILPEGSFANFSGKVGLQGEILVLQNPIYERILESQNGEFTHTAGLIPIYPETKGITSRYLRILIKEILEKCTLPEEWLPEIVSKKINLPEVKKAYRDIHFPETEEDAEEARRRFSFEDLFLLQYANYLSKEGTTKENAPIIKSKALGKHTSALPFKLTDDQQKCVRVISEDLLRGFPMNRLLQGDVGSGKTIVAMLAALSTAEEGLQTAFMAPTEILVRQHFETYIKLSEGLEKNKIKTYPAAVLTSSGGEIFYEPQIRKNISKSKFKDLAESSEIKIYFGTQSLIQKNISFKNLGLVIIDEQHRFGVRQRQALAREKAQNETPSSSHKDALIPHLLSMTATPIPRTLALTVF
jgi:ATP-dependent DNA helicase RecG